MRPRFAARARGSPYSIREEIESSRARKSANLSAVVRAPLYRSSTAPVTRPANQYLMPRYIVSRFRKSIANACASAGSCSNDSFRVSARTRSSLSLSLVSANRRTENCEILFFCFLEEENWTYRHFPSLRRIVWRILWSLFENICFIYTICSNCSNLIEIMLWLIFLSELIQQISYINYVASFLQITPANPIMGRKISIDRSQTRFPFRVNKSPRCNFGTEKRISRISNSISIGTMHRERGGD